MLFLFYARWSGYPHVIIDEGTSKGTLPLFERTGLESTSNVKSTATLLTSNSSDQSKFSAFTSGGRVTMITADPDFSLLAVHFLGIL